MSTELAWAAGFFDGEGCTTFAMSKTRKTRNNKPYPLLFIDIGQVDRRPLDRFLEAVGEGNVNGPYDGKGKRQDFYHFKSSSTKVYSILQKLWPYLSDPKKDQAVRALMEYERNREVYFEGPRDPRGVSRSL